MVALWSLSGQGPNRECGMGGLKFAGGNLRDDQGPASSARGWARLALDYFMLACLQGVEESGSAFSISISIWVPRDLVGDC